MRDAQLRGRARMCVGFARALRRAHEEDQQEALALVACLTKDKYTGCPACPTQPTRIFCD